MKKYIYNLILINFLCLNFAFFTYSLAYAISASDINASDINASDISLYAPEKVAKGDAFLADFKSKHMVKSVKFSWNDKEYVISTKFIDNMYKATLLLPVALENKNTSQILTVSPVLVQLEKLENIEKLPVLTKNIIIYERDRPVEKLKVDKKYVNPPKKQMIRITEDRAKSKKVLAIFTVDKKLILPLSRPLNGSISSVFGIKRVYNDVPRSYHKGLDLRGAMGSPIRAIADGRVGFLETTYFSGNVIYLDHGYGVFSTYSHMSKFKSKYGDSVQRGDIIGYVGSTGLSTGPHLHLGLIVQGIAVDVLPFMDMTKLKKSKKK